MIRRILSVLLVMAALLAVLTGCASSEIREFSGSENLPAASGSADSAQQEAVDYTYAYEAHAADELVMTVNGLPVYWDECFYWLNYAVMLLGYYGESTEIDWDAACVLDETVTNRQFVSNYALDSVAQYRALETGAEKIGAVLTDEDKAELDALWEADVTNYGGGDEETFKAMLAEQYMSAELYHYLNNVTELYYNCMGVLFGENGELCSDEDVMEYAESQGYMAAKHILLSTTDDEGNTIPDEEKAKKLAAAEEVLEEIKALETDDVQALEEKFDQLIKECGEDEGAQYYPAGYCFLPGEMVEEFENTVNELGDYQISEIVESPFGYHIIMKVPVTRDLVVEYYSEEEQYDLSFIAATDFYAGVVSGWIEEAQVEYAEAFADGNLAAVY